jgi:hypothetical protein
VVAGLRTVAFDGTVVSVADFAANNLAAYD